MYVTTQKEGASEERFIIKRIDFKKLEQWADDIYNIAVVINYFDL